MKNILILLVFIFIISLRGKAQESIKQSKDTELGIRMSDFNDFGFIYKKEKSENKFSRIRASAFNVGYIGGSAQIGLQTALGKEKRNLIGERLQFIKGPEFALAVSFISEGSITYSSSSGFFENGTEIEISSGEGTLLFAPAIGYVLGFQYEINDKFWFSVETIPSLQLILFTEMESPIFNLGFNTQAIAITLAYRFKKLVKNN